MSKGLKGVLGRLLGRGAASNAVEPGSSVGSPAHLLPTEDRSGSVVLGSLSTTSESDNRGGFANPLFGAVAETDLNELDLEGVRRRGSLSLRGDGYVPVGDESEDATIARQSGRPYLELGEGSEELDPNRVTATESSEDEQERVMSGTGLLTPGMPPRVTRANLHFTNSSGYQLVGDEEEEGHYSQLTAEEEGAASANPRSSGGRDNPPLLPPERQRAADAATSPEVEDFDALYTKPIKKGERAAAAQAARARANLQGGDASVIAETSLDGNLPTSFTPPLPSSPPISLPTQKENRDSTLFSPEMQRSSAGSAGQGPYSTSRLPGIDEGSEEEYDDLVPGAGARRGSGRKQQMLQEAVKAFTGNIAHKAGDQARHRLEGRDAARVAADKERAKGLTVFQKQKVEQLYSAFDEGAQDNIAERKIIYGWVELYLNSLLERPKDSAQLDVIDALLEIDRKGGLEQTIDDVFDVAASTYEIQPAIDTSTRILAYFLAKGREVMGRSFTYDEVFQEAIKLRDTLSAQYLEQIKSSTATAGAVKPNLRAAVEAAKRVEDIKGGNLPPQAPLAVDPSIPRPGTVSGIIANLGKGNEPKKELEQVGRLKGRASAQGSAASSNTPSGHLAQLSDFQKAAIKKLAFWAYEDRLKADKKSDPQNQLEIYQWIASELVETTDPSFVHLPQESPHRAAILDAIKKINESSIARAQRGEADEMSVQEKLGIVKKAVDDALESIGSSKEYFDSALQDTWTSSHGFAASVIASINQNVPGIAVYPSAESMEAVLKLKGQRPDLKTKAETKLPEAEGLIGTKAHPGILWQVAVHDPNPKRQEVLEYKGQEYIISDIKADDVSGVGILIPKNGEKKFPLGVRRSESGKKKRIRIKDGVQTTVGNVFPSVKGYQPNKDGLDKDIAECMALSLLTDKESHYKAFENFREQLRNYDLTTRWRNEELAKLGDSQEGQEIRDTMAEITASAAGNAINDEEVVRRRRLSSAEGGLTIDQGTVPSLIEEIEKARGDKKIAPTKRLLATLMLMPGDQIIPGASDLYKKHRASLSQLRQAEREAAQPRAAEAQGKWWDDAIAEIPQGMVRDHINAAVKNMVNPSATPGKPASPFPALVRAVVANPAEDLQLINQLRSVTGKEAEKRALGEGLKAANGIAESVAPESKLANLTAALIASLLDDEPDKYNQTKGKFDEAFEAYTTRVTPVDPATIKDLEKQIGRLDRLIAFWETKNPDPDKIAAVKAWKRKPQEALVEILGKIKANNAQAPGFIISSPADDAEKQTVKGINDTNSGLREALKGLKAEVGERMESILNQELDEEFRAGFEAAEEKRERQRNLDALIAELAAAGSAADVAVGAQPTSPIPSLTLPDGWNKIVSQRDQLDELIKALVDENVGESQSQQKGSLIFASIAPAIEKFEKRRKAIEAEIETTNEARGAIVSIPAIVASVAKTAKAIEEKKKQLQKELSEFLKLNEEDIVALPEIIADLEKQAAREAAQLPPPVVDEEDEIEKNERVARLGSLLGMWEKLARGQDNPEINHIRGLWRRAEQEQQDPRAKKAAAAAAADSAMPAAEDLNTQVREAIKKIIPLIRDLGGEVADYEEEEDELAQPKVVGLADIRGLIEFFSKGQPVGEEEERIIAKYKKEGAAVAAAEEERTFTPEELKIDYATLRKTIGRGKRARPPLPAATSDAAANANAAAEPPSEDSQGNTLIPHLLAELKIDELAEIESKVKQLKGLMREYLDAQSQIGVHDGVVPWLKRGEKGVIIHSNIQTKTEDQEEEIGKNLDEKEGPLKVRKGKIDAAIAAANAAIAAATADAKIENKKQAQELHLAAEEELAGSKKLVDDAALFSAELDENIRNLGIEIAKQNKVAVNLTVPSLAAPGRMRDRTASRLPDGIYGTFEAKKEWWSAEIDNLHNSELPAERQENVPKKDDEKVLKVRPFIALVRDSLVDKIEASPAKGRLPERLNFNLEGRHKIVLTPDIPRAIREENAGFKDVLARKRSDLEIMRDKLAEADSRANSGYKVVDPNYTEILGEGIAAAESEINLWQQNEAARQQAFSQFKRELGIGEAGSAVADLEAQSNFEIKALNIAGYEAALAAYSGEPKNISKARALIPYLGEIAALDMLCADSREAGEERNRTYDFAKEKAYEIFVAHPDIAKEYQYEIKFTPPLSPPEREPGPQRAASVRPPVRVPAPAPAPAPALDPVLEEAVLIPGNPLPQPERAQDAEPQWWRAAVEDLHKKDAEEPHDPLLEQIQAALALALRAENHFSAAIPKVLDNASLAPFRAVIDEKGLDNPIKRELTNLIVANKAAALATQDPVKQKGHNLVVAAACLLVDPSPEQYREALAAIRELPEPEVAVQLPEIIIAPWWVEELTQLRNPVLAAEMRADQANALGKKYATYRAGLGKEAAALLKAKEGEVSNGDTITVDTVASVRLAGDGSQRDEDKRVRITALNQKLPEIEQEYEALRLELKKEEEDRHEAIARENDYDIGLSEDQAIALDKSSRAFLEAATRLATMRLFLAESADEKGADGNSPSYTELKAEIFALLDKYPHLKQETVIYDSVDSESVEMPDEDRWYRAAIGELIAEGADKDTVTAITGALAAVFKADKEDKEDLVPQFNIWVGEDLDIVRDEDPEATNGIASLRDVVTIRDAQIPKEEAHRIAAKKRVMDVTFYNAELCFEMAEQDVSDEFPIKEKQNSYALAAASCLVGAPKRDLYDQVMEAWRAFKQEQQASPLLPPANSAPAFVAPILNDWYVAAIEDLKRPENEELAAEIVGEIDVAVDRDSVEGLRDKVTAVLGAIPKNLDEILAKRIALDASLSQPVYDQEKAKKKAELDSILEDNGDMHLAYVPALRLAENNQAKIKILHQAMAAALIGAPDRAIYDWAKEELGKLQPKKEPVDPAVVEWYEARIPQLRKDEPAIAEEIGAAVRDLIVVGHAAQKVTILGDAEVGLYSVIPLRKDNPADPDNENKKAAREKISRGLPAIISREQGVFVDIGRDLSERIKARTKQLAAFLMHDPDEERFKSALAELNELHRQRAAQDNPPPLPPQPPIWQEGAIARLKINGLKDPVEVVVRRVLEEEPFKGLRGKLPATIDSIVALRAVDPANPGKLAELQRAAVVDDLAISSPAKDAYIAAENARARNDLIAEAGYLQTEMAYYLVGDPYPQKFEAAFERCKAIMQQIALQRVEEDHSLRRPGWWIDAAAELQRNAEKARLVEDAFDELPEFATVFPAGQLQGTVLDNIDDIQRHLFKHNADAVVAPIKEELNEIRARIAVRRAAVPGSKPNLALEIADASKLMAGLLLTAEDGDEFHAVSSQLGQLMAQQRIAEADSRPTPLVPTLPARARTAAPAVSDLSDVFRNRGRGSPYSQVSAAVVTGPVKPTIFLHSVAPETKEPSTSGVTASNVMKTLYRIHTGEQISEIEVGNCKTWLQKNSGSPFLKSLNPDNDKVWLAQLKAIAGNVEKVSELFSQIHKKGEAGRLEFDASVSEDRIARALIQAISPKSAIVGATAIPALSSRVVTKAPDPTPR